MYSILQYAYVTVPSVYNVTIAHTVNNAICAVATARDDGTTWRLLSPSSSPAGGRAEIFNAAATAPLGFPVNWQSAAAGRHIAFVSRAFCRQLARRCASSRVHRPAHQSNLRPTSAASNPVADCSAATARTHLRTYINTTPVVVFAVSICCLLFV